MGRNHPPLDASIVETSAVLLEILRSKARTVVVHGDCNPGNALSSSATDGWPSTSSRPSR